MKIKRIFLVFLTFCVPSACSTALTEREAVSVPTPAAVSKLSGEPIFAQSLAYFKNENERNVRELIELTEIPAPPFKETLRAKHFAHMLKNAGLSDVSIDEVGNVIGVRPGTVGNKTVAMVAHIDTVFPIETDVTVRQKGNTYYAPGIGDNSRGLVLLLNVLRAFEKFDISTEADVLFIGSVGEEGLGDLRGVRHLFRDGANPIDSFIAIDGGRNGRLIHGGVGSNRYRVEITGPGGHSWGSFGLANPHHAMARGVTLFVDEAAAITASGDKATFNIGRVGGGTSINSIAAKSWVEVDMRSANSSKLGALDKVLHNSMSRAVAMENEARTRGDLLKVELVPVGKRPSGQTPASSSLVKNSFAIMTAVGVDPYLAQSSTDANVPMSLGVPAITISRGGITKRAHSPEESWQNVDSHLALHTGFLILLAEAGHVK